MRTVKPYLWTLGILWGLPALAVAIGYLVLDHNVSSGCEGIGFGCTLSPADTMIFWAMIVGVPVLGPAGLIGLLVVAVVRVRRNQQDRLHDQRARERVEARAARMAASDRT